MSAKKVSSPSQALDAPWGRSSEDVLRALAADPARGLSRAEADRRLKRYGPNRLRTARRKSAWAIFLEQFQSLLVLLLIVASLLAFAFAEPLEGVAIAAVIAVNAAIGFMTELRAVRSMEALQELAQVNAVVIRDGSPREILAEGLVPGDIFVVEGGDVVTADIRLLEASKLQADESALTGESLPVGKQIESVAVDASLADRASMLFKGTAITRGSGRGVVVTTGMSTQLGRISSLVEEAEEEHTPLEKRLNALGRQLMWITLSIAAVVIALGAVRGKELFLMIETGIALAVATVPEGLPIVATIALARGMWRMARRNALINRLSAVETLGATNVICTDKTGTLTENRMTVVRLGLAPGDVEVGGAQGRDAFRRDGTPIDALDEQALRSALEIGALCNNASLDATDDEDGEGVGDPLEVALLAATSKLGIARDALLREQPEVREEAFDPQLRMMATFHQTNGSYRTAVKGAPEAVLDVCTQVMADEGVRTLDASERERWIARNEEMAADGLRVLAVAEKIVNHVEAAPYQGLTLLGLMGLLDPARADVRPALDACQDAGVRVVMVTGDQPVTARVIALDLGLVGPEDFEMTLGRDLKSPERLSPREQEKLLRAAIFARVSPEQKLDLIELHQVSGSVVAMTGDGVNDAPALKKADIGVAMGRRGTQVAREAADMVLKDDAFATIVAAVEQGRVILNNIRKFVLYLLSCNVSEVLVIGLASLVNAPLPILPLQILFLNLVTDVFPALALGVGEGDPGVMKRPPRDPQEPILARSHWRAIAGYGGLITIAVLTAFALAFSWLEAGYPGAVTISFLTLAFAQLWNVFNMREPGSGFLSNEITQNVYVWGALTLCVGLLLLAVYLPLLSAVLRVTDPGLEGWVLVIGMSLIPFVIGQGLKDWLKRTEQARAN